MGDLDETSDATDGHRVDRRRTASVAIVLTFDPPSDARVRGFWTALESTGQLVPNLGRPHMTLAQIPPDSFDVADDALAGVAAGFSRMTIGFDSLGFFPGEQPVLFLNPVASGTLLALHRRIHIALHGAGIAHEGPNGRYAPGEWVPHVTLGRLKHVSGLPDATGIANGFRLRFELTAIALGSLHSPTH